MTKLSCTQIRINLPLSEEIFAKLYEDSKFSGNSVQAIIRNIVAAHYRQPKQPEVSA